MNIYVNGIRFNNLIEGKYEVTRLTGEKFSLMENPIPTKGALMFCGVRISYQPLQRMVQVRPFKGEQLLVKGR
jgi:hypothetical protein